jgi:3'-phosphoadenosine 5'-phosphosulfate (PAPS) 3'-phosphatase
VAYFPKLDTMFFTKNSCAWESRQGAVIPRQMPITFQSHSSQKTAALRMKEGACRAFETRIEVTRKAAFSSVLTKPSRKDIPYADIQLLRGDLDLHFADVRYQEWDLVAYQAIMEAAGLRYVNAENGQPIVYGADKNLRTPHHWLGHPSLLQRLGLGQQ